MRLDMSLAQAIWQLENVLASLLTSENALQAGVSIATSLAGCCGTSTRRACFTLHLGVCIASYFMSTYSRTRVLRQLNTQSRPIYIIFEQDLERMGVIMLSCSA